MGSEFKFPVDVSAGPNTSYIASGRLEDIVPAPGVLILHRSPIPDEIERMNKERRIVLPDGVKVEPHKYPENCALIVKAGPGCKYKPGQFVFWAQRTKIDDEAARKPHPVCLGSDTLPVLWFLREEYALGVTDSVPV